MYAVTTDEMFTGLYNDWIGWNDMANGTNQVLQNVLRYNCLLERTHLVAAHGC
jgi:hypothetical protein